MSYRSTTLIGAAVTLALFQQAAVAQTQTMDRSEVEEVVVSGIRGSLRESVETKREATAIVDVISAEDMGKFPDKNAAESLSHVPGVNIDRQFGQGERVSIRGTDPALNRTLLNGQTVASADWFILDSPGRTFNYTLLAPEIVSSLEVYKSPEARIDEGSIGGTVILNTRRPIDLPASTLRTSLDYAYNDRAKEGKPNYSALFSWKNDADTFGVIFTALRSEEELERHGIETFSYPTAGGAGLPASVVADRSAVFPNAINSALFVQDRTRNSGTIGLQLKPSDSFELNLTGLYVKAEYDNYNQSRYAFFGAEASKPTMTSATVRNGLITSGSFSNGLTLLDAISRRSEVETYAVDLKADWRGDGWSGSATIGTTEADGGTQQQYFLEYEGRGAYSYDIGKERASVTFANDPASAASLPSIGFGQSRQQPTHDEEQYVQADFIRDLGWGPINQWLFGAKYREHKTDQDARIGNIDGDALAGQGLANFAGGLTPGNMLDGADTNAGLERWMTVNRGALERFVAGAPVVNPFTAAPLAALTPFPNAMFNVEEEISSAYTQFNFTGQGFRGNLGLRYVMTDQSSSGFTAVGGGVFQPNSFSKDYNDWLPSFNFAMDVADDVVVRLSASRSMARANFADLASFVELDNTTNSGRGGNPNLDPYRASNFDISAEWYMGNEGLLAVTLFYKDVRSFIVSQSSPEQQFDTNSRQIETFDVTRPRNGAGGEIQGSELTYQTSLWGDFGLQANYTYADGTTDEGLQIPFSSKHTINLTPYYDNGTINARLTYGWRSKYFREIGRNGVAVTTDEYAQLDAAFGWRLTDNIELTAQILNMLDETHYEYAGEESHLLNLYKNGRRYFAGVRFSL
ncbi:TonB-dependent receptor [Steroidobacter flavus]|uniref:TonB-dependent receptor n=1 Tax=Steroidobacter flavus TaxID=1842136 RepID=A0ABV8SUW8_9GAMM